MSDTAHLERYSGLERPDPEATRAELADRWGYTAGSGSDAHHRSYVGPPEEFDLLGAMQFRVGQEMGLREWSHMLDIGCGALRAGRLFMAWLLPGRYHGIEPNRWLLERAIEEELGQEFVERRGASFRHNDDFDLTVFGRTFDFILAQSILSHTSLRQVETCLANVARVLEPGGVFACTYMEGPDYTGDEWVYPGCVTFRLATLERVGLDHGLRCERIPVHHPRQTWIGFQHVDPDAAGYA